MKTIKRYLALVVIVNTMVLSACGGTGSDQQTLEQRSEEATTADGQQESNSQDSEHASDALPDDSQATVAVNDSGNTIP